MQQKTRNAMVLRLAKRLRLPPSDPNPVYRVQERRKLQRIFYALLYGAELPDIAHMLRKGRTDWLGRIYPARRSECHTKRNATAKKQAAGTAA